MFEKYSVDETREKCRGSLDSLEFWLRRLLHQKLIAKYGINYFTSKDEKENFLIKSKIQRNVIERMEREPERFVSGPLSATTFGEITEIVLNPKIFRELNDVFLPVFPGGSLELKGRFETLEKPRNSLAHSNPVGTRQAEQVVCYSHDIIDAIKNYYRKIGMQNDFNVPRILSVSDSFGKKYLRHEFSFLDSLSLQDVDHHLNPGDLLSLEVEVDPSFSEDDYNIEWTVSGILERGSTKRLDLNIKNHHVAKQLSIECKIISHKDWHAHRYWDDLISLYFTILPPKEETSKRANPN